MVQNTEAKLLRPTRRNESSDKVDGKCFRIEPHHDKTNSMACASSEDSDQPGCPPSLIRVLAVHSMGI